MSFKCTYYVPVLRQDYFSSDTLTRMHTSPTRRKHIDLAEHRRTAQSGPPVCAIPLNVRHRLTFFLKSHLGPSPDTICTSDNHITTTSNMGISIKHTKLSLALVPFSLIARRTKQLSLRTFSAWVTCDMYHRMHTTSSHRIEPQMH
jgi:hypothetical protein